MSVQASYGTSGTVNTSLAGDASSGGNNVWTGQNVYAAPAGPDTTAFYVPTAVAATDPITKKQLVDVLTTIVLKDEDAAGYKADGTPNWITGSKLFSGVTQVGAAAVAGTDVTTKAQVDAAVLAVGAVQLDDPNNWTAPQDFIGGLIIPNLTVDSFTSSGTATVMTTPDLNLTQPGIIGALNILAGCAFYQAKPNGYGNPPLIDVEFNVSEETAYFYSTATLYTVAASYQVSSAINNPFVLVMTNAAANYVALPMYPICGQEITVINTRNSTTVACVGRIYYTTNNAAPAYATNSITLAANQCGTYMCWGNTVGAVMWLQVLKN